MTKGIHNRRALSLFSLLPISLSLGLCLGLAFDYQPAFATSSDVIELNNEGVKALNSNNFTLAIEKFQEALKKDANYQLAKDNLAIAFNNYGSALQNNPKEAIKQFHQALYLNQNNPTTIANLEGIIGLLGKNPGSFKDRVELGDQARMTGDMIGAVVEYAEAVKLKDDPKVRVKLGDVYRVRDDVDKAISEFQAAARSNDSSEVEVKLGQAYQAKKDLPNALQCYDRALGLKPDDPDVLDALVTGWEEALKLDPVAPQNHIGLGKALQYRGDFDQAAAEYKQALFLDRNNAMARQLLDGLADARKGAEFKRHADAGVDLQTRKLYDAAIQEYLAANRLDPRSVAVLVDLGTVYQAKEDFDSAISYYNKALALEPSNALAAQGIKAATEAKENQRLSNDVKEGLELFKLGKYDDAIAKYSEILRANPKDAVTHFNLGATYQAKNDLDSAISEYREAASLDTKNEDYKKTLDTAYDLKSQPIIDQAIAKHKEKDYASAIDLYLQAIALRPKSASLLFDLAGAYYAREDYTRAREAYAKALDLDPKGQADNRYMMAVIDENFGQGAQSLVEYQKYIAENPQGKYVQPSHDRVKALSANIADTMKIKSEKELAQIKEADDDYQQAIKLQQAQQWDQGISLYQKAIDLQPKEPAYPYGLGTLFQQKGDMDLAINWYQKALDLDPKNKNYQQVLQAAYELKAGPLVDEAVKKQTAGDLAGAIDLYKRAIQAMPTKAMLWRNLGTAYQQSDDFSTARQAYQKALELDPKGEIADNYLLAAIDENFDQGAKALQEYRKYMTEVPTGEWIAQARQRAQVLAQNPSNTKKLQTRAEASRLKEANDAFDQAVKLQQAGSFEQAIPLYQKALDATPNDAGINYAMGTAYQAKGDIDSAIQWYQKAIVLDAKNADYKKVLKTAFQIKAQPIIDAAIKKHGDGDLSGAIPMYQQALTINPENAHTWTNLAGAQQGLDDFAAARESYQKALQYDAKGESDDWYFLGQLDENFGQGQKALQDYQRYTLDQPKGKYAEFAQGRIRVLAANPASTQKMMTAGEQKKATAASDAFQNAVQLQQAGKYDEAIDSYKKALDVQPSEASYWYSLGTAYQAKNDIDNALASYIKASQLNPKEPSYKQLISQLRQSLADPLINDAIKAHSAGDYAKAISLYQQALQIVPNNARTWTNLAAAYQASDDFAHAREFYQKALDIDAKGEVDNWYFMAALDENANQGKKAFGEYEKYYQLAPKGNYAALALQRYQALYQNPNAVQKIVTAAQQKESQEASDDFAMAIKLQQDNKFTDAIDQYKKSIAISPNDASYWYSLGTCYQANNNVDEALQCYSKAVQLNAKEPQYKQVLQALQLTKAGPLLDSAIKKQTTKDDKGNYDLAGAIADYEAALRIADDANTHLNLGTAYQANNDLPKALAEYKRALAMDGKQVDGHYYLGTIYEAMKQPALALQEYKEYLRVAPTGSNAADAKERIKILSTPAK